MLAFLLLIQSNTGFQTGDNWTTERTLHLLQDFDHVDTTTVQTIKFVVGRADPELNVITSSVSIAGAETEKPLKLALAFKPNGVLMSSEPNIEPDAERINRIKWTALEARAGISWSRSWPATSNLLEAKVNVRPTARSLKDKTVSVTYVENGKIKCSGTLKILYRAPVVQDLQLTIVDVDVPQHAKPGRLIVSDKLTDLRLKD